MDIPFYTQILTVPTIIDTKTIIDKRTCIFYSVFKRILVFILLLVNIAKTKQFYK